MLAIVDIGISNTRSLQSKLQKLGISAVGADTPEKLEKASRIILPGVGAFAQGMQRLRERHFLDVLYEKAFTEKIPILGVCLGMQLMTQSGEEGNAEGLGWFPTKTVSIKDRLLSTNVRIPHVGWNTIKALSDSVLLKDIPAHKPFYFTHSFCVELGPSTLATVDYGFSFSAMIEQGNLFGTQFHPEKCHRHGLKLLENFVRNT